MPRSTVTTRSAAEHLGLGDPHDPLGAGERVEAELRRERRDRPLGGRRGRGCTPPASGESASSRPSSRLASVTVGSAPPRP